LSIDLNRDILTFSKNEPKFYLFIPKYYNNINLDVLYFIIRLSGVLGNNFIVIGVT